MDRQEEEEDEWEDGEINGYEDEHEINKVPESDIHGKNREEDKVEEDGHEQDSRPSVKPTKKDAAFTEDTRYINQEPLVIENAEFEEGGRKDQMREKKSGQNMAQFRKGSSTDDQETEGDTDLQFQEYGSDIQNSSDQIEFGETQPIFDLDGAESSKSIDLNSEPLEGYDWQDLVEEDLLRRGKSKKSKNKDRRPKKQANGIHSTFPATMKPKDILKVNAYRRYKKTESNHKNHSSPNKSENSLTISEEITKTKFVGSEVGFQVEGFEEMLRKEIEGEGMTKKQP
ncbi:hypothetical protein L2E82_47991 [Cichorium intybus]|uniref:Uncharacterized protein n=1 Tax=Cichorium intybus TaxID=13427 RepID=A0ACB8YWX9_CICIN|nr:hypothetical protein L2E82_47991 [Cichorium intybus]